MQIRNVTASVAAIAALGLAACGGGGGGGSASTSPIIIGVTGPLSGDYAAAGIDIVNAAKVTADLINNAGGVNGRKIQIESADDQCDAQVGVQAANNLLAKNVVALAGGYCSGASIPETDVLRKNGDLPSLWVASSNPKLTEQGYDNVFRLILRDDLEGPNDINFLVTSLKKQKIAILHDNSTYAKGLADAAKAAAPGLNAQIVYFDALTPKQNDYTSVLTRIATANPDALLFTGYFAEAATLVKQYKQLKLDSKFVFMGGGGEYEPGFLSGAGDSADGFYTTSPPNVTTSTGDKFKAFQDAYKKVSGGKDLGTYSIYEYDAINILALAIKKAGGTKAADVNKALREVTFDGITGPVQFNAKGDRDNLPVYIFQVKGGKFVPYQKKSGSGWVAV